MMKPKVIKLSSYARGVHLITDKIVAELDKLPESGLLHLFLQHTSAGLTLGENSDPDILKDLRDALDALAPENKSYRHNSEGPDDMPAHIKQTLTGHSLMIPIIAGKPALGTWRGIYLCEFRNNGGSRKIVATVLP